MFKFFENVLGSKKKGHEGREGGTPLKGEKRAETAEALDDAACVAARDLEIFGEMVKADPALAETLFARMRKNSKLPAAFIATLIALINPFRGRGSELEQGISFGGGVPTILEGSTQDKNKQSKHSSYRLVPGSNSESESVTQETRKGQPVSEKIHFDHPIRITREVAFDYTKFTPREDIEHHTSLINEHIRLAIEEARKKYPTLADMSDEEIEQNHIEVIRLRGESRASFEGKEGSNLKLTQRIESMVRKNIKKHLWRILGGDKLQTEISAVGERIFVESDGKIAQWSETDARSFLIRKYHVDNKQLDRLIRQWNGGPSRAQRRAQDAFMRANPQMTRDFEKLLQENRGVFFTDLEVVLRNIPTVEIVEERTVTTTHVPPHIEHVPDYSPTTHPEPISTPSDPDPIKEGKHIFIHGEKGREYDDRWKRLVPPIPPVPPPPDPEQDFIRRIPRQPIPPAPESIRRGRIKPIPPVPPVPPPPGEIKFPPKKPWATKNESDFYVPYKRKGRKGFRDTTITSQMSNRRMRKRTAEK